MLLYTFIVDTESTRNNRHCIHKSSICRTYIQLLIDLCWTSHLRAAQVNTNNIKTLGTKEDAKVTHGLLKLKTHGVENRNRLSERVSWKNDSDFRLRLKRVLFRGQFSEARDRL